MTLNNLKWTLTRKSAEMTEVKGSPLKVIRLLDKVLLILIQNYGSREAQSILSKLKMVPKKLFKFIFEVLLPRRLWKSRTWEIL